MSTRSSIYYDEAVHLFEECLSEDICLDIKIGGFKNEVEVGSKYLNEKYESFTMPEGSWRELNKKLTEYFADKDARRAK